MPHIAASWAPSGQVGDVPLGQCCGARGGWAGLVATTRVRLVRNVATSCADTGGDRMTAEYTWDVFSTLDGYGSYGPDGDWGGYWSKQGPELLAYRAWLFDTPQRMVFGATTFRENAEILLRSSDPHNQDEWNRRTLSMPATVISSTLHDTLGWPNATVVTGDAAEMKVRSDKLRFTNIPLNEKFAHGKKLALTVGLKSAQFDHVLLTDADCYPASKLWLQSMAGKLGGEKNIVLGYGRYEKQKGLLNVIIRYETVFTAIQYLSFALKGRPYMGVGRNLAYRKDLFFKNKGFAGHYHIASGDDDLFVNQHAFKENTAIEIESESHTISIPKKGFAAWIRQKRRHLLAGNLYKRGTRVRLGLEIISRLLLYASFTSLMLISDWLWPLSVIFGLFVVTRMWIFKLGMIRLNEKYLLLPSLLLDLVMPLILGTIWIINLFVTKKQPWS